MKSLSKFREAVDYIYHVACSFWLVLFFCFWCFKSIRELLNFLSSYSLSNCMLLDLQMHKSYVFSLICLLAFSLLKLSKYWKGYLHFQADKKEIWLPCWSVLCYINFCTISFVILLYTTAAQYICFLFR